MKTIPGSGGEEAKVEGIREVGGQNMTSGSPGGETERDVRPGKFAGA